jgi:hypothetical protein
MKKYAMTLTAIIILFSVSIYSQIDVVHPLNRADMALLTTAVGIEGTVHFKTLRGYYLSAEHGGGGPIHARASMPGEFESFILEDLNHGALFSGDQIKLRTSKGNLVFASENGRVSSIYFIDPGIEVFTIKKVIGSGPISFGDVVCLSSSSGKFVTAKEGGGGDITALVTRPYFTEAFFLTAPASAEGPEEEGGEVKRRIEADGTVVLTYPDGTVEKHYQGGYTVIHPDGRTEVYSFMSGQPPTMPPAPDLTEQEWLEYHAEYLLNFIENLVGYDEESINLYLSTEEGLTSIYGKIMQRTLIISKLLMP